MERFEERAAIIEFDGGFTRDEAERRAIYELIGRVPLSAKHARKLAEDCRENAE